MIVRLTNNLPVKRHHTRTIYALLRKSGQDFWKSWKSKFGTNNDCILQVDGISDSDLIAGNSLNIFNGFALCSPLSLKGLQTR